MFHLFAIVFGLAENNPQDQSECESLAEHFEARCFACGEKINFPAVVVLGRMGDFLLHSWCVEDAVCTLRSAAAELTEQGVSTTPWSTRERPALQTPRRESARIGGGKRERPVWKRRGDANTREP